MSEREDELEQQAIEINFQQAMNNVKKQNLRLQSNGFCHNCEENVDAGQVFCDVDCREDYEKRKRAESQRLY